jgi:thiamine-phosphate pyrophosphorylase
MEAGEAGADYVAFGAFYPSTTKDKGEDAERPTPEILNWWSKLFEIPCVAIGGITPENCTPLIEAGADFLAVSGAVWSGDEVAAIEAFAKAMRG